MPVQFKFRGEKAFRTLLNVTTPCTVTRVKNAIYEQARINADQTELSMDDSATGGSLDAGVLMVPDSLVQVIVRRTPVQALALAVPALEPDVGNDPVIGGADAEDLAIDRVVEEHELMGAGTSSSSSVLLRYSRSYRLAAKNKDQERKQGYAGADSDEDEVFEAAEPPPPNYTCHRCGLVGEHWIWECPTNEDPDHVKKVRTARGVPRDFLKKVATLEEAQEQSAGGVTFSLPGLSGHYIFAHEASQEDKKRKLGDTLKEKVSAAFTDGARKIEEKLKCPLCHQMFRQAILAPCCGATFCSDCAIDRLASASIENSRCPGCRKELYAHQLVANEDIRRQVEKITQASKANALALEKEKELAPPQQQQQQPQAPKAFELSAALKDRVNRPKKNAAPPVEDARAAPPAGAPAMASAASTAPAVQARPAIDPSWQPLGFGPLLNAEQFAEWQRLARAGLPAQAKDRFAEWQRQVLEALPPAAQPPPSKESFEEWQKALREGKQPPQLPGQPPGAADVSASPPAAEPSPDPRQKKSKKEKKEHKRARMSPPAG